ncbi:hypothetical protein CC1G_06133 [Coprinopsis cinerea okayama7|uniref:Cytochrome P450 n=1 Tax=Coprinopsis cinerea (strain Okayama-7 / 130 / ATCC MYA-4618 / FGSC 9003) TaxID=240176 RepID=A8PAA3_COPC7|nr:hypothetical protein CC1G_06133 [Coprinopsis cinerea okayama7\|eukprot:XP_001839943.1 hypothetical protein CC1G_06133 [Coprinopsis cinerea okayama7\
MLSATTKVYFSGDNAALGLAFISLLFVVSKLALKRYAQRKRNPLRLPFPPGPPGIPLFGNALQVPRERPCDVYRDWSKEYGSELIYLDVLGQPIVVLNSMESAVGVLEKKAANTSSRPLTPALDLMQVQKWNFPLMPYGHQWRARRRAFHQAMMPARIPGYHSVIEQETRVFLQRLELQPSNILAETQRLVGQILIRVAYGSEDYDYNRKLVENSQYLVDVVGGALHPGKLYLVNVLPFIKHLPRWFPGTQGWRIIFDEVIRAADRALTPPFLDAKERLTNRGQQSTQSEEPSLLRTLFERMPPADSPERQEQEAIARQVAGLSYIAGADTTLTTAHALIFAFAKFPKVQRKGQQEVDTFIESTGRVPKISDRGQVPYIEAIIKEILRWFNAAPLGLPHQSTEDEEYNGYFIPKGTILLPNAWAILHDPNNFENPEEFKPERYLRNGQVDHSIPDGESAGFGFGRRVCPGRNLSKDVLFFLTVGLLATFEIRPPSKRDESKPFEMELVPEVIAKVLPFDCEVVPRATKHLELFKSYE